MNNYLEAYCHEFDQEFNAICAEDLSITEYNQLVATIDQDQELKQLINEQRQLQTELMNLRALKQEGFVLETEKKLITVDNQLATNEKLNKLKHANHLIDLKRKLVKIELAEWKEKYVIKNKQT